jgi:hypothetical protein
MEELLEKLNLLQSIMTSVSTGGQDIKDVNDRYKTLYGDVAWKLKSLKIANTNPYSDLWEWHGKWRSGDMPQYKDRRIYLIQLFKDVRQQVEEIEKVKELEVEIGGWDKIERTIEEVKTRIAVADNEEKFQAIGLLCRETTISLAQQVYVREKHPPLDGVEPSKTDAKRMLDSYISVEFGGAENENVRRYAKSALALTNELTHKRTATKRDARLCSSATINLVNLIRINIE